MQLKLCSLYIIEPTRESIMSGTAKAADMLLVSMTGCFNSLLQV